MNWFAKRDIPYSPNGYKDHKGIIVDKYCSFLRKYVIVIEDKSGITKLYVGRGLYEHVQIGSKWTIGEMNGYVINFRPGFCKTTDDLNDSVL